MSADLDKAVQSFRDLDKRKEPVPPARHATVRVSGPLLGAAVMGVYTLVGRLAGNPGLPGAPGGGSSLGWLGTLLIGMAVGGILGLVCAWPRSAVVGIAIASACIALALGSVPWLAVGLLGGLMTEITVMLCAPLGFAAFFLISFLPMGLLRWAASVQGELAHLPWWTWRRVRLPLALLVLAGVLAY